MIADTILGRITVIMNVEDFSDSDKIARIKEELNYLKEVMDENYEKDWSKFTKEDVDDLGFMLWTDDQSITEEIERINNDKDYSAEEKEELIAKTNNTKGLYLIPQYLINCIPMGTKLYNIFGNEVIYDGNNIDDDARFGALAYGIHIKEDN